MQTNTQPSKFETIASWVVPIAAIAAVIAWFIISPEGALGKLDAIGYAVCHRIDARSFQIDERQLPLCARCTGEFYAAGIALLFQAIVSGRSSKLPSRRIGELNRRPSLLFNGYGEQVAGLYVDLNLTSNY